MVPDAPLQSSYNTYSDAVRIIGNFPRAKKISEGVRPESDTYQTVFEIALDGMDNMAAHHLVSSAICVAHPHAWLHVNDDTMYVAIPGKHDAMPKGIKPALDKVRDLIIRGLQSVDSETYVLKKDYNASRGMHHIELSSLIEHLILDQQARTDKRPHGEPGVSAFYTVPSTMVAIDKETRRRCAFIDVDSLRAMNEAEAQHGGFFHEPAQLENHVLLNKAGVNALLESLGVAQGAAVGRC